MERILVSKTTPHLVLPASLRILPLPFFPSRLCVSSCVSRCVPVSVPESVPVWVCEQSSNDFVYLTSLFSPLTLCQSTSRGLCDSPGPRVIPRDTARGPLPLPLPTVAPPAPAPPVPDAPPPLPTFRGPVGLAPQGSRRPTLRPDPGVTTGPKTVASDSVWGLWDPTPPPLRPGSSPLAAPTPTRELLLPVEC